jgi:hypothetical protein
MASPSGSHILAGEGVRFDAQVPDPSDHGYSVGERTQITLSGGEKIEVEVEGVEPGCIHFRTIKPD